VLNTLQLILPRVLFGRHPIVAVFSCI